MGFRGVDFTLGEFAGRPSNRLPLQRPRTDLRRATVLNPRTSPRVSEDVFILFV